MDDIQIYKIKLKKKRKKTQTGSMRLVSGLVSGLVGRCL